MLLVIDVGNTNTVLGALVGDRVVERWRVTTKPRTTDEMGLLLLQLLKHRNLSANEVTGVCISCVVPTVLYAIEKASRRYLRVDAVVIGRGARTGMRVRTDNPREVGADRIVNSVAAYERHVALWWWSISVRQPHSIASMNRATIWVGPYRRDSRFRQMLCSIGRPSAACSEQPNCVIGTNTVQSMQAGLFFGRGLVDELSRR